jgi:hypothetical protein
MTTALSVLAALGGFVVAVMVILNLHIVVGLEDGYAASPAEVIECSVLLGVLDIALLVAGPVLGIVAASRFRSMVRALKGSRPPLEQMKLDPCMPIPSQRIPLHHIKSTTEHPSGHRTLPMSARAGQR